MEGKEFQTAGQVTQDMVKEWQEKFGKVEVIDIPITEDDVETGEMATFYLRKPTRAIVEQTAKFAADKDYSRANNMMIKNCVLGGDMKYLASENGDDDIFFAVLEAIGSLVGKKKASFRSR